MHEPRGKQGLSLAYATAPAGADHMRAPHDPVYEGFHPQGAHALEPMGLAEAMPRRELSPRKVRAFTYANHWWALCSCSPEGLTARSQYSTAAKGRKGFCTRS